MRAVYPKLHHGASFNDTAVADLYGGWAQRWQAAGAYVAGWGWLEGDPVREAQIAVYLCRKFDLDGYIANAETAYEFDGAWKSKAFVDEFRRLAPRAPLALSFIGEGYPYRMLDFTPWVKDGAALMPQCYWSTSATSTRPSYDAAVRAGLPLDRIFWTLGTSAFETLYPAEEYRRELDAFASMGVSSRFNVWLLENTLDDDLRTLIR